MVLGASAHIFTALLYCIAHIVRMRAQKQMIWIDAQADITFMQNMHSRRGFSAVEMPRYSMGTCSFPWTNVHAPVGIFTAPRRLSGAKP
jgi:hypothetical protein